MSKRDRVLTFGAAGSVVVAGAVCGAVIGGGLGQMLALGLIGLGLVAAVSLVFYEVGLSEDHERARDAAAAEEEGSSRANGGRHTSPTSSGRRLGSVPQLTRMRGHRRRLR